MMDINRRKFINRALQSSIVLGASPYLSAAKVIRKPTAKNVIYIYLAGGISHVDSFDPKEDIKTSTKSIDTNVDGIKLGHHFRNLSTQMDKVALIRSMKTTQGAHEEGEYYLHSSYTKQGTIQHPCLGSWVTSLGGKANKRLPGNVRIGGSANMLGSGFMSNKYQPLVITDPNEGLPNSQRHGSVSLKQFNEEQGLANLIDESFMAKHNNKAIRAHTEMTQEAMMLMGKKSQEVFDISKEDLNLKKQYGLNTVGQGCMLARKLVENGINFVEVVAGGWDDHNDIYGFFGGRAATLDRALASLISDLERRGLLDETLVVVATEFGRSPGLNANDGRNHWPRAFSGLMAGGGIQGGQAYGATDSKGHTIIENPVGIEDFNATIAFSMGLPFNKVIMSPTKRPFKIAHKGVPVYELFKA